LFLFSLYIYLFLKLGKGSCPLVFLAAEILLHLSDLVSFLFVYLPVPEAWKGQLSTCVPCC
jgi:hypothetical protein